jgi:hypothetical protein
LNNFVGMCKFSRYVPMVGGLILGF